MEMKRTARVSRQVPRPFEMPWGKGEIVEEATAIGEWSEPAIQLLRYDDGTEGVRFCQYDHRGRFRRSPMMVSATMLRDLGAALDSTPRLRRLLRGLEGGSARAARARPAAPARGRTARAR